MAHPPEMNRLEVPRTLKLAPPSDEFDALAELFLGSEPSRSTPRAETARIEAALSSPPSPPAASPAASSATTIEALVLGHLPVRASPWVSQFAKAQAQQRGAPIALLRVTGGEGAIDLFGLSPTQRGLESHASFAEAVQAASNLAHHWILQLDEPSEPEVARDPRLSCITLLAGGNEAAIVAAYRTLKSLAPAPTHVDDDLSGETDPSSVTKLRVAVVGAEGPDAEGAAAKLRHAAEVFLCRPVEYAGSIARVGPAEAVGCFRGTLPLPIGLLVGMLLNPGKPAASGVAGQVAAVPAPRQAVPPPPAIPPRPAMDREPSERAHEPSLGVAPESLGARLGAGHLSPLAARCPDDPAVEFAVDADRRLHALRDADSADAYERLAGAMAWASRHAELISLAERGRANIDPRLPPVGHLFTPDPRTLRHLTHVEIKLHLFAPATLGAKGGWCCVDLN